jgi:formylglycine-generating enzyme required for sulfatase activity
MKTIEEYRNEMESTGYAYYNQDAFNNRSKEICYIPENAETLDECYTYLDLLGIVEEWAKDNAEYLEHHQTDVQSILNNMFENLSWEFPTTYLNEL